MHGQTTKTFTGKITEIAKGTQLDIGKTDIFYTVRLEEYHKISFRLTPDDAVRFGVIDKAGISGGADSQDEQGHGLEGEADLQRQQPRRIRFRFTK